MTRSAAARSKRNSDAENGQAPAFQPIPSNQDAEWYVIAAVLIDPATLDEIADLVSTEDFFWEDARAVFGAMVSMRARGQQIDPVTISAAVADLKLKNCGVDALERISDSIPHAQHAAAYARMIRESAVRRAVMLAGSELARRARAPEYELADTLGTAVETLHNLIEQKIPRTSVSMSDALAEALASLDLPDEAGLKTGFHELDELVGGLRPGSLTILAARSGVGKTALAAALSTQVAGAGEPVLFHSLEMTRQELILRMLSAASGIPSTRIRSRQLTEIDRDALVEAASRLSGLPLAIDDEGGRTVGQLALTSGPNRRRQKPALIIIDYLQFIEADDHRAVREQQVARISKELKRMAKRLGVPVVCLAQLNREIEKREVKRPRLADLRESGAIEQDADMVWFIDRPSLYDSNENPERATLIVAKNRHGRVGDARLRWIGARMVFENAYEGVLAGDGTF